MSRSRTRIRADALDLLKQDHERIEKAFREFEKMDRQGAEACQALIQRTCQDLTRHTVLEEEIFYPALRAAIEDPDLLNEAGVEHETARMLIEQLDNMGPDDPSYFATFTVLGEYVRHHIREEQGEMFPAARRAGIDLAGLAERMQARRDALARAPAA